MSGEINQSPCRAFQPGRQDADGPAEEHLRVAGGEQQEHIKFQNVGQAAVSKSRFRETRNRGKVRVKSLPDHIN